jgi:tRNA-dihydrouridine synthase
LDAQWEHIVRHCRLMVQRFGNELHAMACMRSRLMAYSRGMPQAKQLRASFAHVASIAALEEIAAANIGAAEESGAVPELAA